MKNQLTPFPQAGSWTGGDKAKTDVVLDRQPAKYIEQMNGPNLSRILDGLDRLSHEPIEGDIKKLTGSDGYRLRIGTYRIIFRIEKEIIVSKIATCGQAYKE